MKIPHYISGKVRSFNIFLNERTLSYEVYTFSAAVKDAKKNIQCFKDI